MTDLTSLHGGKIREQAVRNQEEMRLAVNLVLLILVGILLVWYAFWSNFIAVGEYKENLLKLRLSEMEKYGNELLSQKSDASDIGSLLVFSKERGLVEQRNTEYLNPVSEVARGN